ncbi:hypothetical protein ABT369_02390 [Dactylosporangium sp. NPDC000244]|uniref:hypothetical protein n=1 Tax=Dactylosporangium sp. NPDC000244 TaxID=3154365 RepID=UPI0033333E31
MSQVAIWPTTDAEGAPGCDSGAVITVRYGPVGLSTGHLTAEQLVRRVYIAGAGTVRATARSAAIQALAEIAERVNDTIRHFVRATEPPGAEATTSPAPGPGTAPTGP